MTLSTVPITGSAQLPDGQAFTSGVLVFALTDIDTEGAQVLPPASVSVALTGVNIPGGTALWRNSAGSRATMYKVSLTCVIDRGAGLLVNRTHELGYIQLGAAASYDLGTLLAAGLVPPVVGTDFGLDLFNAADAAAGRDLLGVAPAICIDNFSANTVPGTTDMTAAILAAATAAAGGGTVVGTGAVYAVSVPIDLSALTGITFERLSLKAIGTGWASGDPIFLLSRGTNATVDITFDGCDFEGNHKANGVSITNCGRVKFERCTGHGFPLYAVKTTTKAGELVISNCSFNQYNNGESGWNVAANRTASLIDLDTDDFKITHTNASYCLYPLRIRSTAEFGQLSICHFFNDGYTPVSGQPYTAQIDGKNIVFDACDFDNGMVGIDAFALSNPALPWSVLKFNGCHFRINGAGVNINGINLVNADATAVDLNGLVLVGNTGHGFASKDDVLLFTGSFLSPLRWTGIGNIMENGIGWGGIDGLSIPAAAAVTFQDAYFTLADNLDSTKQARFQLSGLTPGAVRTYLLPDTVNGEFFMANGGPQTVLGNTTFSNDTNTFGSSAGTSFNNLGTGATTNGVTKTVAIGTAGQSGSVTNITLGPAAAGALGQISITLPVILPSYTVAALPSASSYPRGTVYVSNETGGAVLAFSDGTNWRRVTDRAVVS